MSRHGYLIIREAPLSSLGSEDEFTICENVFEMYEAYNHLDDKAGVEAYQVPLIGELELDDTYIAWCLNEDSISIISGDQDVDQ